MASNVRLAITTGDADGIGWEVTAKALNELGPQKNVQFVYFRHQDALGSKPRLSARFKKTVVRSIDEAETLPFHAQTAVEIQSSLTPAEWVETSAKACLRGKFQALVTAPLSKTSIVAAGFKDIGHTEILGRVAKVEDLYMGFIGKNFNVVLMTGHRSLKEVIGELNERKLESAIHAVRLFKRLLPVKQRIKPIALVGVNPHAGEEGLIGKEELWMEKALQRHPDVAGPLVPDAAFLPGNWSSYCAYLCPYHDQGLIPFKMVHGFKGGVHLTLGLPFVRTSVDHGTAKDLFGKNKAEHGSMKDALKMAIRLSREKEYAHEFGHFSRI